MLLKKIIPLSVTLTAFAALQACYALTPATGSNWPTYGEVEDLGAPLTSTQVIHGAITKEGGVPVAVTTVSGDPAKFNVFDLENDRVLRSFDIPKGKTFWIHGVDSKGDVFFAGYVHATLYHYSVADGTLKEVGPLFGEQAACSIAFDDDDNVYIGTYPRAKIIKYDRKSGELVDLGNKLPDEQYFKSLAYHDGYLYGGGMKSNADFVRIAVDTMEVEQLPKVGDGKVSSYYYANKVGDLLFMSATTGGGNSSLFVYDLKDGKWLDMEIEGYRGLVTSPEYDGVVYFSADNNIWEFDMQERKAVRTDRVYNTGFRGGDTVTLTKDTNFSEPSFVNFFYNGTIGIYDFKNRVQKTFKGRLDPAEGVVSEIAHNGSDVLAGEFMGTRMVILDSQGRKAPVTIPLGQAESVGMHGGKIYFGIYPAASVEVYDPSKPAKQKENPRALFNLKAQGQSRPFGLTFTDSKLIVGMTADYGLNEGALAVYDLQSGKLDTYKNILADQNYTSLTQKDGTVWGATTIFGGLGVEPTATAGLLFSFDPETGRILRSSAPKIDGIAEPIKVWSGTTIGPDGLLWAMSYGMVVAFDPSSLRAVKHVEVMPTNWGRQMRSWGRGSLSFTKEGLIVSNPGNTLVLINPKNMEFKRLLPPLYDRRVSQATVAPDGDIYFRSDTASSRLLRLRLEK